MGSVRRTVGPGVMLAIVLGACSSTVENRSRPRSDAGISPSSGGAASSAAGGAIGRIATGGADASGAGGSLGSGGSGAESPPCEPVVAHPEPIVDDVDGGLSAVVPCTLEIPAPPEGHRVDYKQVNVAFMHEGAPPVTLRYVADRDMCSESAWYYDNPVQPSQVILCPATCELLHASPATSADLWFGCRTLGT